MAVVSFPARNKLAYPAGALPGFDPAHVAAQGTVQLAAIANNGNFYDARKGIIGSPSNANTKIDEAIGPSLISANSSFITTFPLVGGNIRNTVLASIFRLPTATTAGAITYVVGTINNTVQFTPTLLFLNTTLYYNDSAGANVALDVSGILGHPVFFAASNYQNNANWVIGDLATGQTWSGNVASFDDNVTDTNTTVNIGNRTGDLARTFTGPIAAAMLVHNFRGKLSIAQLQQWAKDPWAFWYPPQARSRVAAAATATFLAGWAQQTNLPVLGTGTY